MLSVLSWAEPAQAQWQRCPKQHKIPAEERQHSHGLCACPSVGPFTHMADCVSCFVLHLLQSSHSYRTVGEIPIIHSGDRAESTF